MTSIFLLRKTDLETGTMESQGYHFLTGQEVHNSKLDWVKKSTNITVMLFLENL